MDTITMWATLSSRGADARSNERPLHTTSETVISSFDAAKIRRDAERAIENDEKNANRPAFQRANVSQEVFVSNARRAVEGIKQEKATAEQWLAMLQKQGGLKAGEDKWLGLSDFLNDNKGKSLTKQEVLDYIKQNQIQIEEVSYADKTPGRYDYQWNVHRDCLANNTDNAVAVSMANVVRLAESVYHHVVN